MTARDSWDVDRSDGRNETLNQRMDRNWNEMLQELRVTQTGTQILSGFLLTVAFQPTFAQLPAFDRALYLALVLSATVTTALALAPVHLHRALFRQHSKPIVVQTAHLLLRAALVGLTVVIIGIVLLVFDVATKDRAVAVLAASVVAVTLVGLACVPAITKTKRVRRWLQKTANPSESPTVG
jgi:hypothetical protein